MPSYELLENERLAAEMASISVAHSQTIVENATSSADLNRYQNELDNSNDRVQSVKDTLEALQEYEVTPGLVNILDASLARSEVSIPPVDGMSAVVGAEALGITLMPKDYIFTRLAGIEGFIDDFFNKSRLITAQLSIGFKETYILFTQSQDSLLRAIDLLDNSISTSPPFNKEPENILLGNRLFNLFKVHGKISERWIDDLEKLNRTITGLSNNYYLNNRNNLNSVLSFFGGFSTLDQVAAEQLFKTLPTAVPSERFKECTYPNKVHSVTGATAKQSVELMGGAYFYDVRQDNPKRTCKAVGDVEDFVQLYVDIDRTAFDNTAPVQLNEEDVEVASLSASQIKAIIKQLREVHKNWRKVYEGGDRFKLTESDYTDITKSFYEANFDDRFKNILLSTFSALVRKNQMELLGIRAAVNTYLVLINSGLVELCHTSIKVNTP